MKAITAISFAFLFLIQAFLPDMDIACEMKKLPTLFHHFYEHKEEANDSFMEFLQEDYLHSHNVNFHHKEGEEQEDLPFRGHHHCCNAPVFCLVEYLAAPSKSIVFDIDLSDHYQLKFYSADRESLLQPPQISHQSSAFRI